MELCGGDQLKAEMIFSLCDWQHPSTLISEWGPENDTALEEKRAELMEQDSVRPAFRDLLDDANQRAGSKETIQNEPDLDRN